MTKQVSLLLPFLVLLFIPVCRTMWEETEEDYEDTQDGEEYPPWMEPHYFMRPGIYVDGVNARQMSVVPARQEVAESTYRVVRLTGGYQLPDDLRGTKVQLDLEGEPSIGGNIIVNVSKKVVTMKDKKNGEWKCYVPDEGTKELSGEEIDKVVVEADAKMKKDVGSACWVATLDGWGMEYCWNQTFTVFDLAGNSLRANRTEMGRMPNRTHAYQLAPDHNFLDPLALHTTYTSTTPCTPTFPLLPATTWSTSIWFHCTLHSPDHLDRDRYGPNPNAVPWAYNKNSTTCNFRLDIWSKAVCAATLPLLHLNRKYVLCVEAGGKV
eukprot:TRINITY_DN3255_c6_g1_i2.p1 TRINITY_DN3255_c6_g1~~TRINITY_DN3255_c6_g1_i2.p1  ORF type:complete len:345 (+),score=76.41 TRINITY_DN3255_c6_g1_i2:67-1035(+)